MGTGADGAGALPASSDIINIVNSHFNEESVDGKNKKREVSHMSYVYGDEESQHHNIPEYSADPSQYEQKHQFEPKLPEIEEREASHASTTYKTESHTKHTVIDVSLDQQQQQNSGDIDNVIVGALDNHNSSKSPKNKMVIKIYPPSLQAVASKSPTAGDDEQERYFD